ncbi:MAG TPA: MG2 domain-containing protein, partial [Nevskiaceae bacterium]|nr:MG2 domain-containing protein [Nevskiaceae bacterium]
MPSLRLALRAAVTAAVFALAACHPGSRVSAPPPPAPSIWSQFVASHTAGMVSKDSSISVRFARDLVPPEKNGKDASDALKVEPAIAGTLLYSGKREIVLTPAAPLPPGQQYRVTLNPQALAGLPAKLDPYQFDFRVLSPDFSIKAAGIEAAPSGDDMVLRGTLETADAEDGAVVEKLLIASIDNQPVALQWAHFNDNRTHYFSATGIKRATAPQQLHLAWSGKSIGLETAGTRDLEIPQSGVFKVLDASLASDGRQSVQVRFSAALDAKQNLGSLVRLGKVKVSTRIDGSTLYIYPDKPVIGEVDLQIDDALRNAHGGRLAAAWQSSLKFENEKPQVRFAGRGVILPDADQLTIPLEGMNVHAVQVTAFQVYESDMGQFLQDNNLAGGSELHRVGRYLWRKTIQLPAPQANQWTRYALDAGELLKKNPGGLYRLSLSIDRSDSLYACAKDDAAKPVAVEKPFRNMDDNYETSSWEGSDEYYEYEGDSGGSNDWSERDDPCKDSYYRWGQGTHDARNFAASNIGLLAKRGSGGALRVVATRLRDAAVLSGAQIEVRNFQNQKIGGAVTDADGFAAIELNSTPFYLVARKDSDVGYLKLNHNGALPVSHFDTGGETVKAGLKGFIYGERGVWRPGDEIHLDFVLLDRTQRLPPDHPVTMQLYDPKGRLVQSITNTTPLDGFYAYTLSTASDAPTGTWTAKALVGGAEFTRALKIETVMPNRLKMELKFAGASLSKQAMPLDGTLWAQWLHGASASGLKADIAGKLDPVPTHFTSYTDYIFDDPARSFSGELSTLFEGRLDADGNAKVTLNLAPDSDPPGLMQASFTTRVFENGGAFSTAHSSFPYHAYPRYVGLKLPKTDDWGYLAANTPFNIELAALDDDGKATDAQVQVSVYRIDWYWWWDRSEHSLAEYAQAGTHTPVLTQDFAVKDGHASGKLTVKSEDWGRYLVRACDTGGGHCTGKVVYVGYSGWAVKSDDNGPGASALRFSSDKPKYTVGETATLQLPNATAGRALLSVENGSSILEQRWVDLSGDKPSFRLPITAPMAPNVYVSLTLVQPHSGRDNDRPLRLYGIVPIEVTDPQTMLAPVIESDKLWRPSRTVSVQVSEHDGREMTYTLAVVDEGLLGLTSYKTPNPHDAFYQREALGVSTWDLYDDVAGAYGGELERLLALGGDQGGPITERKEEKRFPPVVRVYGPFHLAAGEKQKRDIDLPEYIGEVRVMVVAGHAGAYGSAEKSVTVREPLSLLATLPRVLGPNETVQVPVSVFAYEPGIRDVKLSIETDALLENVGAPTQSLHFNAPGEQMAYFTLKVKPNSGAAHVTVRASAGAYASKSSIAIGVRPGNPVVTRQLRQVLQPGKETSFDVKTFGLAGTNAAALEVSRVPPLDLERRLNYLIQYPHGCIEQTTSSVFPQLYLDQLIELSDARKADIERNINAAIERLRSFQTASGAFSYWPGDSTISGWANDYAGHFLTEAKRLGYHVPDALYDGWLEFQRRTAENWAPNTVDYIDDQSYRLLTLALADRPDVGAMNRLRETGPLDNVARVQLAQAYAQIGLNDAASALMHADIRLHPYGTPGPSYGSETRDRGILLLGLLAIGDLNQAERMAEDLSADLSSDNWYSTQSTAYGLLAMARFAGGKHAAETFSYSWRAGDGKPVDVTARHALSAQPLPKLGNGGALTVKNNSQQPLFVHVLVKGSPLPGEEDGAAAEGLSLSVNYTRADGSPLEIKSLAQGTDFVAHVTVGNHSAVNLDDLALSEIVASGWEIHNPRFEGESHPEEKQAGDDYESA